MSATEHSSPETENGLTWKELHKTLTVIKNDYIGSTEGLQAAGGPMPVTILVRALIKLGSIQGTKLKEIPGFVDQVVKTTIVEMKNALIENEYSLVMGVGENMACYVMEYDVRVDKSIDMLKLVYWYGHGVIELFTGIKRDIAKIALLLMMDNTVRLYTKGQGLDHQIFSKLAHTLLQERTKDNLGRYGVYMIFKNAALMCVDNCSCGKKRVENSE